MISPRRSGVQISLKQGTTTLAIFGVHSLTGIAQDFEQVLTTEQADSVTDYSDLRIVCEAL